MQFPNASSGIKKIFTAEILQLIGSVLSFICALLAFSAVGSAVGYEKTGSNVAAASALASGAGMMVFFIAASVLMLIAFIFNLMGIVRASRDESTFKIALYAVIAGIVFTALSGVFSGMNARVSGVMDALGTVADLVVTLYVIQGIRMLASRMNNREVDNRGQKIYMIILGVLLLRLIANIIVVIFGGRFATAIGLTVYLVSIALSLVQYIMYLIFLAKAKKMLA